MMLELKGIRKIVNTFLLSKTPRIARIYNRVYTRVADVRDKLYIKRYMKQTGLAHLPPADLRNRVHGSTNPRSFLEVGKKCSEDLESTLRNIHKDIGSFRDILDFGCGCGRTLMWFGKRSLPSNFFGTDIDADAISWCRNNLDFASFSVNNALPPLDYPSETFDLIYALSVFTHLHEDYQYYWLSELKRIVKPKGILLLTVHGQYVWKDLPPDHLAKIEKEGFVFVPENAYKGIFPEWYQNAFHTKDYVLERWSPYFNILDYIPRGLNNHQDMVVLQKA